MSAEALSLPRPRAARAREAALATVYLGIREVRTVLRQPAAFIPGLIIPVFFYFIQVAALSELAGNSGLGNYKGFQLPVAILFAVSNGGAGLNLVTDIESGYFEKLLLTPANRMSILVGAMGADFVRVLAQGLFTLIVAMATGLEFATGVAGGLFMVLIGSLWGLAYSAMGFGIALKTGNSQATQSAFVLFFPFVFLTTTFAPLDALSGWLRTAAVYNPVTYLLRGMRALSMTGWDWSEIALGLAAIGGLGAITVTLAFRALVGRLK